MGISGELYIPLGNYLSGIFQRIISNGQTSSWRPVLAVAPQGSMLGSLLFLVYIYDLSNELKSGAKLFVEDTSFFTIVRDNESANIFTNDLFLISKWPYNCKSLFNQDPSKPPQEVLFSRKKKFQIHHTHHKSQQLYHKHLGNLRDGKAQFQATYRW